MVVGDGINGPLALKAGVVGVAMGAGGAPDIRAGVIGYRVDRQRFASAGHLRAPEP